MLIKRPILEAIRDGRVDQVFRRWQTARVRSGSTLKTSVGVLEVISVEEVVEEKVTARDARRAGLESKTDLLEQLAAQRSGSIYRIRLRHLGEDPRIALRQSTRFTDAEFTELDSKVQGLGARSDAGPWGIRILRLIADNPGVRAPDLAEEVGMIKAKFKPRVRQLKELGLTESLKVGYRLSPRGKAYLQKVGS